MNKKLIAMRGYVVIKQKFEDETTATGIIKPGVKNKIVESIGTVTSIGPTAITHAYVEGDRLGYVFFVGAEVMYNPTNAMIYKMGEETFVVVPERDVVAVIKTEA